MWAGICRARAKIIIRYIKGHTEKFLRFCYFQEFLAYFEVIWKRYMSLLLRFQTNANYGVLFTSGRITCDG